MYPLIRLAGTLLKAKRQPRISFAQSSEMSFICRPWDIDMFLEMNNGRILTLYDLGRFDLAVRTGLSQALKQNQWGLVVAGSTVRYRKRVRMFDKVSIKTQLAGFDERWVYLTQSMWVKGEPCSSILLRTGVTSRGKVISPELVKSAMGLEGLEIADSAWLESWKESEGVRPWPPA